MFRVFIFFSFALVFAEPPRTIPQDLYNEYTLNNQVPVHSMYFNDSYPQNKPIVFKKEEINLFIKKALNREENYYGNTDKDLYAMLDKYASFIEGKSVAIVGSITPWYECVVLGYGGNPVTIEYNKLQSEDPRIRVMTVDEFEQNPEKFDAIISISSIEHDGLGRYGDPIDPNGDFKAIKKMKTMLKEGGLLFLAVPIGQDCIVWNAHRIYGPKRFPLLIKGWKKVDSCGFSEKDFHSPFLQFIQPVFVLSPL